MEPASSIIQRLGGVGKVAEIVGVHRVRVSNWKRPKKSGGTGGRVPQSHHVVLLAAAERMGVPLCASDFLETRAAGTSQSTDALSASLP